MNRTNNKEEAVNLKGSRITGAPGTEEYVVQLELQRTRIAEALRELYELLEEYAPAWYTEDRHERAKSALQLLTGSDRLPSPNGLLHARNGAVLSS
jgi:hypothetical protein